MRPQVQWKQQVLGSAGPRQGDGAGSCLAQAPTGPWPCHIAASVIPAGPEHWVSQPLGIHYRRLVRLLQGAGTQPGSSRPFPSTVVDLFHPDSPLRGTANIYGGLCLLNSSGKKMPRRS